MATTVFLDTNIYLHYQDFDQIDWTQIVQDAEVTIILPPITIRELNKHKDGHPRPRVKKRADGILRKLWTMFSNQLEVQIRQNVKMRFEARDPLIKFSDYQLSNEIQDDHLIASILMESQLFPLEKIVLITSDRGLALMGKALHLQISSQAMPENFKLPEEPEPEQERIRELEEKLRIVTNTMPSLSLTFENGENRITFALEQPQTLLPEISELKLTEIKEKYRPVSQPSSESDIEHRKSIYNLPPLFGQPSPAEIDRYNSELAEFYERFSTYLIEKNEYENFKRRMCSIEFFISNKGTAPAKDIDVMLHFPDGFTIVDWRNLPEPPKPPEPPEKPLSDTQKLFRSTRASYLMPPPVVNRSPSPPPNISSANIKRTNSYDISYQIESIKHQQEESVGTLFIIYDDVKDARPFHVDYSLLAANVPNVIKGQLHVIMKAPTD